MSPRRIAIIGGGTSGSIVATWLASRTKHEIVVFEPGRSSAHDHVPGFFDVLRYDEVQSLVEVRLVDDGPLVPYPQARTIGGGSAINGMLLTGAVPYLATGAISAPDSRQLGAVSRALLAAGGRVSDLWWNEQRWNPGRELVKLVESQRVQMVASGVERVVFEGRAVTAIHCADREIEVDAAVMCAGALMTPMILQSSGLDRVAPGIGEGLQDHPSVTFAIELEGRNESLFDAGVVFEGICSTGDRHLVVGYERASWMEPELGLVSVSLMTPRSRGSVRVRNGQPLVQFSMLSDATDVIAMRDAVRDLCSIVLSKVFAKGFGPAYADDEGLSVADVAGFSDAILDGWIRSNLRPVHHAAASSSRAIDSGRRVVGISNLWVADASALPSVPPETPAGHVTMEAAAVARIMGEALG